jgi:hypothetical protein
MAMKSVSFLIYTDWVIDHFNGVTQVKEGALTMALLMRWMFALLLLSLTSEASIPQESEDRALVSDGFVKTEQYLEMGKTEQGIYAAGLIDGIYLAPLFDAANRDEHLMSVKTCVKGMSNTQVAAIITKYAKEHPERWHMGTNLVAYQALWEACPKP